MSNRLRTAVLVLAAGATAGGIWFGSWLWSTAS